MRGSAGPACSPGGSGGAGGTREARAALAALRGDPEGAIAGNLRAAGVAHTISIDPRPREDLSDHVSDQWLSDLKVHGVNGHIGPPRLVVPVSLRAEAHQVLQAYREGVAVRPILLHPGSGGRDKCWGTAYMDQDDPMRRMNMAAGGKVLNQLRRNCK